ncbi:MULTISPECIES: hypothetical protein [Yersinia]|uniref:Uncharacterized protein n=2 Tax=Yersinia bercovieri TaxID=634 RepID=A0A2G4U5B7_YERBE|nr:MULTISPECIES: hypothetical protein [Yersinia]MCB5303202.1 hypothetical protein [Yersinia bercovieri]MDN0102233.1 hypothetical protein [Yersinia bercovieri]PHZ28511.1 hypothetical protein CS533_04230 [Yersinia bercovieri]QDW32965.1 hypothetical protein FFE93_007765 [Yersinia sp. KBS0713]QKJ08685.1 hypothetical protein HRK25_18430 [Yersinia bercovieri ATCC 43970]
MDSLKFIQAMAEGIKSIPMDLYLGVERTFQDLNLSDGGRYYQQRNMFDDKRFLSAFGNLIRDRSIIAKMADIIINDTLSHLPDEAIHQLHEKLIYGATGKATRMTAQMLISGYISGKVVSGLAASSLVKLGFRFGTTGMVSGVMLQGIAARASEASRKLAGESPLLYSKLRPNDYDMLFFLFEKPFERFLQLSKMVQSNPLILGRFANEIKSY